MKLYDQQFVYYRWSDTLKEKECFVADTLKGLEEIVNGNLDGMARNILEKSENELFRIIGRGSEWRFAYYDPDFDCKKAYQEGIDIEYRINGEKEWHTVPHELPELVIYANTEYRIKNDNVIKSRNLTKRELAQWAAKGYGEIKYNNSYQIISRYEYETGEENTFVSDEWCVRKWDDEKWHKPTISYCYEIFKDNKND